MTILLFLVLAGLALAAILVSVRNTRDGDRIHSSNIVRLPEPPTLNTEGRPLDPMLDRDGARIHSADVLRLPEPPTLVSEARSLDPIVDADGNIDFDVLSKRMSSLGGDPHTFAEWLATELDGSWFPSKVAGVSHRNDDRTSRQAAIKRLEALDLLELVSDPANKYDPNAIRVTGGYFKANFEWVERQIGFLNSRLAGETSLAMKRGTRFLCFVLAVTGEDQDMRGVNIAIVRWEPKK